MLAPHLMQVGTDSASRGVEVDGVDRLGVVALNHRDGSVRHYLLHFRCAVFVRYDVHVEAPITS